MTPSTKKEKLEKILFFNYEFKYKSFYEPGNIIDKNRVIVSFSFNSENEALDLVEKKKRLDKVLQFCQLLDFDIEKTINFHFIDGFSLHFTKPNNNNRFCHFYQQHHRKPIYELEQDENWYPKELLDMLGG